MTSRIAQIAIDAVDPAVVAEFWCAALGWKVLDDEDGVLCLGPEDGSWPGIDIAPVPDGKPDVKNRLHLDLRADGTDTQSELDRLISLGARHADIGQGDVSWHVLADPEGNEFCLLKGTAQELGH